MLRLYCAQPVLKPHCWQSNMHACTPRVPETFLAGSLRRYGLETKNRLVDRLREEVDLFVMTPECTLALDALDALKEQLDFHYQRITQHVVSFADARLKALPLGGPASQPLCIRCAGGPASYVSVCAPFVLHVRFKRSD